MSATESRTPKSQIARAFASTWVITRHGTSSPMTFIMETVLSMPCICEVNKEHPAGVRLVGASMGGESMIGSVTR
jgi:hypothetical protein